MNIYTIYKATNIINNKVYIGFTSYTVEQRTAAHLKNSKNIKNKFYNAIVKYGKHNFIWEIIYQSLDYEHTLKIMENHFIVKYDSFKRGYNSTLGGEGIKGWTASINQTQNRIDSTNKRYAVMTERQRKEKYGLSGNLNNFFQKTHTPESLILMSKSHEAQRSIKIKCEQCNKEVDKQNYKVHHGTNCGKLKKGLSGKKWFHTTEKDYFLFPTDPIIISLTMNQGRLKGKVGRPKKIKL